MAAWRYLTLEVNYLRATCDSDMSSTSAEEEGDGTGSAFWSGSRRRLPALDGLTVVVDRSIRSAIASGRDAAAAPYPDAGELSVRKSWKTVLREMPPGNFRVPGLST